MTRPTHRIALFLSLVGCGVALGCDREGPRVYTAMPVDMANGCLGDYVALGLVEAEDLPATCAPVCLQQEETLYVSTVCGPYPANATLVSASDSSDCESALALLDTDGGGACASE